MVQSQHGRESHYISNVHCWTTSTSFIIILLYDFMVSDPRGAGLHRDPDRWVVSCHHHDGHVLSGEDKAGRAAAVRLIRDGWGHAVTAGVSVWSV